ncbi:hypothetical protein B0H67DRAFT_647406 [Lasiosphaeris hirsuta]|uniref:Uncharacterized protein n=1 Tax=Lasiosphaeris hirsuta TaxID=260670 RepID=A0AA40AA50_9PEZI|nr:hypothetical protein B0H67DRAFT_647406 [Lasiosphaeris hirsuta]
MEMFGGAEGAAEAEEIAEANENDSGGGSKPISWRKWREWWNGAFRYLGETRAGLHLFLLSFLWILSDAAWYCLSLDFQSSMSTFFISKPSLPNNNSNNGTQDNCPDLGNQRSNPDGTDTTVYRELERNSTRFMLVVSIGSILGSSILIVIINRFHRRNLLTATCFILAILFAISGGILVGKGSAGRIRGTEVDVFIGMMHLFFSLGPKTLILIVGVEIFPTVYGGTFYGMAAAMGKLGAVVIRPIIGITGRSDTALGVRLLVATALMVPARIYEISEATL